MALNRVDLGIQYFPQFAADRAIANAFIYIGLPNLDPAVLANQIQAYIVQENGTQVAVPQPIRTGAGGVPTYNGSPVQVAVDASAYSVKVLTSTGSQIYYVPDTSDIAAFSTLASAISYTPPGYSSATNAGDIFNALYLQDYVALRAYAGESQTVRITGLLATAQPQGIAGTFQYDATDITSVDNGGTIIVGADGRRWKRVFEGNYKASWFGVSPNVADNATALIQMRDYMSQFPGKWFVVEFPEGEIAYSNNRWTLGISNLEIIAYNTDFRCTGVGPFGVDTIPLKTYNIFYPNDDQDGLAEPAQVNFVSGSKIATIAAGQGTLTLLNPADSSNFEVGDYVLIHGFDQQFGGFPPNMRYFEWRQVIAINPTSGFLTLDTVLKNSYDQNWWDFFDFSDVGTAFVGAARVLQIKSQFHNITENLIIKGAKFLVNPNFPAAGYSYFNLGGVLNSNLIDCDLDLMNSYNATNQITNMINGGTYRCDFELDKLVDTVQFRNVRLDSDNANLFHGMSAATGCNLVDIQQCKLEQRIFNISPRNLVIKNNDVNNCKDTPTGTFYAPFGTYFDAHPINSLTIEDNRMIMDLPYYRRALVNLGVTSKSLTVIGVSGTDILLNKDETTRILLQDLDIGQTLTKQDGSYGGVITRIYDNGANIVVQGTWTGTPAPADVFVFNRVKQQSIRNNPVISGQPYFLKSNQPFTNGDQDYASETLRLCSKNITETGVVDFISTTMTSQCYVKAVYLNVLRAYTGPYGDTGLYIRDITGINTIARFDVSVLGVRRITQFDNDFQVGDTTNPANLFVFMERLAVTVPVSGTAAQRCEFTLDIELVPVLWTAPV